MEHTVENVVALVRTIGNCLLMGDHDNGHTIPAQLPEDLHDLLAGLGVQRTCGFICQQQIRFAYNGSGDGHTLALTAGELIGQKMDAFGEANGL